MAVATRPLGQILKDMQLVSEYDVQEALKVQKQKGGAIGQILLEKGLITDTDLLHAMGKQSGMEVVDVATVNITSEVVAMVDVNIAETCRVMPVSPTDNPQIYYFSKGAVHAVVRRPFLPCKIPIHAKSIGYLRGNIRKNKILM